MKLLLSGPFQFRDEQISRLQLLGYELVIVKDERAPLQINVSDIDAVVCSSLFHFNDISNFKELKLVQLTSAGLDRIPIDYIRERNIKLFNAKDIYSGPIAEWVILKILEIYKKSRQFYQSQEQHHWQKQAGILELTGKTVAIIGFGDIGTAIAKRLKGFGVHIIGVGRRILESDILDGYCLIADLTEVLSKSDIVILTLPLTEDTRHLINNEKIDKMKDACILINVSRGSVVDEKALIEAIRNNKFSGVALDVFEEEPLSEKSPLWGFENVIITPHNSYASDQTNERLFEVIYKNLDDHSRNAKIPTVL